MDPAFGVLNARQSAASESASSRVSPCVMASGKSRHVTTYPPSSLSGVNFTVTVSGAARDTPHAVG